jgi:hypothetical protein
MWRRSQPVPAYQQPPLFKHKSEAEQVLNFMEHIEPALLFSQLSHIAVANCTGTFARTEGAVAGVPCIRQGIVCCHPLLRLDFPLQPELCDQLGELEILASRAVSLLSVFTSIDLVELILVPLSLLFLVAI